MTGKNPQLLMTSGADFRHGGLSPDIARVEDVLLRHAQVDTCVVLRREVEGEENELVAYVVSTGRFSEPELAAYMCVQCPELPLTAFVPVSTVPLKANGDIDREALSSLPVVDSDLVERWKCHLESIEAIDKVAVLIRGREEKVVPLHLSDLLSDWQPSSRRRLDSHATDSGPPSTKVAGENQRLAISHGKPMLETSEVSRTLPETLQRAARQSPEKGMIFIRPDGSSFTQSYPELVKEAERILAGLRELGLKPQDKVLFQFRHNWDFLAAFWGCILGGIVPVPLSVAPSYENRNGTLSKLQNAWHLLERPIVLTDAGLAPMVRRLTDLYDLNGLRVESVDELRKRDQDPRWFESQPDDTALLMLTSGSTGMPKAVVLSHRNLVSRSAGSLQMNAFSAQDVSLNWMPLDHVAGLIYFHLRDVFLGCQQIHAPTDTILQEPLLWLDWLELYQVTVTFAPNFAFALVNQQAEVIDRRNWDLSSARFFLNGGEAIVAATARRFIELLLPHGLAATAMYPAWGMSETSSGVTYSDVFSLDSTTDDDPFVEVGHPIPGFSMRIVDDRDRVMPEGSIGRLQVKGATVTSGYYQSSGLNRQDFSDDGWFITGDLGLMREGRLTITGREKDVIIINSVNYYSHEIESVVEGVGGVEVSFTAACAVREPGGDTDALAIFFVPMMGDRESLTALLLRIRKAVLEQVGVNPAYLLPVCEDEVPKTAIGKIQRTQMSRRFAVGEFDSALKNVDILSSNANTIPDWFYRKTWQRKKRSSLSEQAIAGTTLVLLDQEGVGSALCTQMGRMGRSIVTVEIGEEFHQLGPVHFQVNPESPEHYQLLMEALDRAGMELDCVLHLWTLGAVDGEPPNMDNLERSQGLGLFSLLFLIQALVKRQSTEHPTDLVVASSYSQSVLAGDEIEFWKGSLLGFLKTVPQEMPWLSCRHIDLPPDNVEASAHLMLQEIQAAPIDREVAFRHGERWTSGLEKAHLSHKEQRGNPFKRGGLYLLSGGLGGIGALIARHLLESFQARLLLIGRTPLPERDAWKTELDLGTDVAGRIAAIQELEQLGGALHYEAVDICDLDRLQQVTRQAEAMWGSELQGVLHLAGLFSEQLVMEETLESLKEMLRPRLLGAWSIHQLLKQRSGGLFITFSSVNGFFGGYSVGGYAAASSLLESLSHYQRGILGVDSRCYSWSLWNEVGMSRGYRMKELSQARGYHAISPVQGLNSLLIALYHDQPHLLIGIDGSNRHIAKHTRRTTKNLLEPVAYLTAGTLPLPWSVLRELRVLDRFGTESACSFVRMEEMPHEIDGSVDKAALLAAGDPARGAHKGSVHPQTDTERIVAELWMQVLGVTEVDVTSNFFDRGGNSLLMAQINRGLRASLNRDVSMVDMFRFPTIRSIAAYLSGEQDEQDSAGVDAGQTRGARRRERMRRRKRSAAES